MITSDGEQEEKTRRTATSIEDAGDWRSEDATGSKKKRRPAKKRHAVQAAARQPCGSKKMRLATTRKDAGKRRSEDATGSILKRRPFNKRRHGVIAAARRSDWQQEEKPLATGVVKIRQSARRIGDRQQEEKTQTILNPAHEQ